MKSMFSPEQYEWFVSKYNSLLVSVYYKVMQVFTFKQSIFSIENYESIYFTVVVY